MGRVRKEGGENGEEEMGEGKKGGKRENGKEMWERGVREERKDKERWKGGV